MCVEIISQDVYILKYFQGIVLTIREFNVNLGFLQIKVKTFDVHERALMDIITFII